VDGGDAHLFHAARALLPAGTSTPLAQFLPPRDRLFLACCRRGSGTVIGAGLELELVAGQILALRAPIEADLRTRVEIDVTFIGVPAAMLTARLGRIEPLVHASAPMPQGFGLMFDGLAVAIDRARADACAYHDLLLKTAIETALVLIEHMVPARPDVSMHARLVLARAKRIIALRLDDPAFGPSALAAALGITPRYLRGLFAADDTSASGYIAAERLRRGRRMLVDATQRHRQIIDIARASGFVSQSHFSRAFRSRFGLTPTALRARHSDNPSAERRSGATVVRDLPAADRRQPDQARRAAIG
jgi:AraC-like DNA-binding protein